MKQPKKGTPYRVRWGHERTRFCSHPRREERRMRAYARGASTPTMKETA